MPVRHEYRAVLRYALPALQLHDRFSDQLILIGVIGVFCGRLFFNRSAYTETISVYCQIIFELLHFKNHQHCGLYLVLDFFPVFARDVFLPAHETVSVTHPLPVQNFQNRHSPVHCPQNPHDYR
jgi:hypothetical protein